MDEQDIFFEEKPKRKMPNYVKKALLCGLAFGLSASIVYGGSSFLISRQKAKVEIVQVQSSNSDKNFSVSDVASSCMPMMVSLDVTSVQTSTFNPFTGQRYEYETPSSGTGIVFSKSDDKLYILTNYHVVEGARKINATFIDNEAYAGKVTGYDESHDLAVVEINLNEMSNDTLNSIKIGVFAKEDDLTLGEPAIAIGNALGSGQSVTVGYVSALSKEVQMTDKTMTLIQTDAAINPGNSGGALLNSNGEIIGINSSKYSDTSVEGMGFAIPVSTVMDIIPGLVEGNQNEAKTVYLGISGSTVTSSYVQSFGWPEGVYVSTVQEDSPASKANIEAGDIITKFDDQEITSMEQLQAAIQKKNVGDQVKITVSRQNKNGTFNEVELTATLAERVDEE